MVKKTIARPRNFDEFLAKEGLNENLKLKYLTSRKDWLNESKAETVIDRIPTSELPECEKIDAEHSKIGDFIARNTFEDIYEDEKTVILDELKEDGILCYSFNDVRTWWKRKIDKEGDGLVRIK